jgi:hypothetical protein
MSANTGGNHCPLQRPVPGSPCSRSSRIGLSSTATRSTTDWMRALRNGVSPLLTFSRMIRPNRSIYSGSKATGPDIWERIRSRAALALSRSSLGPAGWSSAQQSRGEFASTISTTRRGRAAVSKREDTARIQLTPRSGLQPFQSGASSRHPRSLRTQTLGRSGRMARSRGPMAAWTWAGCALHGRPAVTPTEPLRRFGGYQIFRSLGAADPAFASASRQRSLGITSPKP